MTKFLHGLRTTNEPLWVVKNGQQIQDGGGRHLEFRENVNNSGLDNDICIKFGCKMHHGHADMTT